MMGVEGTNVTLDGGMLTLREIAYGLSQIPRFAGQTVKPWYVVDHLLAGMVYGERNGWTKAARLHYGLHDATEAVTGDIPQPFKTADMRSLQRVLDIRLYERLELDRPTLVEEGMVHALDREMLLAEAAIVCPPTTYQKIVQSSGGRYADHEHRVAVGEVLSWNKVLEDAAEAWLDRILPLILDVQEGL